MSERMVVSRDFMHEGGRRRGPAPAGADCARSPYISLEALLVSERPPFCHWPAGSGDVVPILGIHPRLHCEDRHLASPQYLVVRL